MVDDLFDLLLVAIPNRSLLLETRLQVVEDPLIDVSGRFCGFEFLDEVAAFEGLFEDLVDLLGGAPQLSLDLGDVGAFGACLTN